MIESHEILMERAWGGHEIRPAEHSSASDLRCTALGGQDRARATGSRRLTVLERLETHAHA